MVDAARQMLDELMGRNRNLHPSEAVKKISWEDPEFCQYYIVKFCPHDLFINTRADLGPCSRLHDDEARRLYEEAHPSARKRHFEDEFLRFCNTMLNDVDRKIQKGKQRLQLMRKDQPLASVHVSKYQEQLTNIDARIKKLVTEAEEAGIRGDVDQARDLMILCDQLREEKEILISQRNQDISSLPAVDTSIMKEEVSVLEELASPSLSLPITNEIELENSPKSEGNEEARGMVDGAMANKKLCLQWSQDNSASEKQMEVCEICGAFLIVGDAQQRIEDHLMGKQHMGYSKLRNAVTAIHQRRQKEREDEDKKRRGERAYRTNSGTDMDRRRDFYTRDRERERERDRERLNNYYSDRHRRHHSKSHRRSHSHSRSSHRYGSRSRSRSRY